MELTMPLIKVVHLIQYSNQKTAFKEHKVDLRPWKLVKKTKTVHHLTTLDQKVLQDIKKSFEDAHLDAKIY